MKVISTKVHGMLDYPLGLILLFAPEIFGFSELGDAAVAIPRIVGVLILVTSIFTKYELGLVKMISMANHLRLDYAAAILLAISPFLFGFADEEANAWAPHVVVGLAYLVASMMTRTEPEGRSATAASH
jgi:hypothetical protein